MPKTTKTPKTIPVYVPDIEGNPKIRIGTFMIYNGTMIVKFAETLPAEAMQRMLDRDLLIAMTFVMLESNANEPGVIDPVPDDIQQLS